MFACAVIPILDALFRDSDPSNREPNPPPPAPAVCCGSLVGFPCGPFDDLGVGGPNPLSLPWGGGERGSPSRGNWWVLISDRIFHCSQFLSKSAACHLCFVSLCVCHKGRGQGGGPLCDGDHPPPWAPSPSLFSSIAMDANRRRFSRNARRGV